ncbi:serine/threonine-protein kinase [Saccharothrix syringae]|uniref:serine/threonine-protein kinase n=1 Tax=Saccharothrix syringae TaxID=103733 RepID=UPI00068AD8DA|nr:serine/threonine-protein kinase [Saccharothrix syringae]
MSENLLAGRYELAEPLGTGGVGAVRRAWDTVLRRYVAVKLCRPGVDPEVRLLAGLSHPGLVAVYDADTDAGTPFVVLQLVEGRTLRELVDGGPLPPDRVRRLGAALADALAHVHDHGLVHREVEPANVLVDDEGNAHLADFGLVQAADTGYLAPEQVQGGEVDHRADVYALGLVLLECLTGRREYDGGEVEAAVARLHRPPVVPEDLPPDLAGLLARMTSAEPGGRPTAHECARVLGAVPAVPEPPAPGRPAALDVPTALDLPVAGELPVALARPSEAAPRRRPPWRTLVASAGVLLGAFAITTAATTGQDPATSAPSTSTPPAPTAQHSATPQVEDNARRELVRPQIVVTVQVSGTPRQTTTAQPAPPTEDPTGTTAVEPTTAPVETEVTTTAAPTTTEPEQETSTPVVPPSESSEGTPEPVEPTSPAE